MLFFFSTVFGSRWKFVTWYMLTLRAAHHRKVLKPPPSKIWTTALRYQTHVDIQNVPLQRQTATDQSKLPSTLHNHGMLRHPPPTTPPLLNSLFLAYFGKQQHHENKAGISLKSTCAARNEVPKSEKHISQKHQCVQLPIWSRTDDQTRKSRISCKVGFRKK